MNTRAHGGLHRSDGISSARAMIADRGWAPALTFLVFFLLVGGLAAWRVRLFIPREFDLGYFVSGFEVVLQHGLAERIPWAGVSLLEDHFSPAFLLLAPVAVLPWSPVLLVLTQVAAVTAAVWIVWRRSVDAHGRADARILAIAVALHPALLYAALWDIHANTVALPAVALFVWGLMDGSDVRALVGGIGATLFREDIAVFVLLAVLVAPWIALKTRIILGLVAGSAIGTYVLTSSDLVRSSAYGYVDLSDPLGTMGAALSHFFENGWIITVLVVTVTPWLILGRARWRLVAVAYASVIPVAFGVTPVGRSLAFHYYGLIPVVWALALVSIDPGGFRRRASIALVVTWAVLGPLGVSSLAREYTQNSVPQIVAQSQGDGAERAHLRRAIGCVADQDVISVDPRLVPWLASGDALYVWPQPFRPLEFATGAGPIPFTTPDLGAPSAVVTTENPPPGYRQDTSNPLVYWSADIRGLACDVA